MTQSFDLFRTGLVFLVRANAVICSVHKSDPTNGCTSIFDMLAANPCARG